MDYSLLTVGFKTGASEDSGTLYFENTGSVNATLDSVDLFELDDTVIKGVDISFLPLVEAYNGHYYANGVRQDFFDIMQNRGVNAVLSMIFVEGGNPVEYPDGNSYAVLAGYFDKEHTIALAKRAKAHNMKFDASFHYSDYWMSAGKAYKPQAWEDQNLDQLQTTMYNYTYDFLKSMDDAGVMPDFVKMGNEEKGIVWDDGKIWSSGREGFAKLINASYAAIKDVSPSLQPDSRNVTIGTYRGNNKYYSWNIPASYFVSGTNTLNISVVSGSKDQVVHYPFDRGILTPKLTEYCEVQIS